MKKIFSFLILLSISIIAWAQPTINNAENFTIGTVLKFQKCNPTDVSPGNAGANQTWDFSTLKTLADTATEWILKPSATTKGKSFPTANMVEKYSNGRFVYINKTSTENFIVGYIDTTSIWGATHFTKPVLFAKRPFKYGTVITDTFTMSRSPSKGIITINADAYGTLILPNGKYNNVLRVKIVEEHPLFKSTVYVWFDGIKNSALLKIDNKPNVEYLLKETDGVKEN